MENTEIGQFINLINTVTVAVMVLLAVCGAAALILRKSPKSVFRGRIFLQALCFAAIGALALEATAFNYPSYLKRYAGPALHTMSLDPNNQLILKTSDGTLAEVLSVATSETAPPLNGILFHDINRYVSTVWVDMDFNGNELVEMHVQWTDRESIRGFYKKIYKNLPRENYTAIHPNGPVTALQILFRKIDDRDKNAIPSLIQIKVNEQIPFYFSGVRLLAVSLLLFALMLILHKRLRAKTAYFLFEYKFNPLSIKQNLIYASTVIALILFSWICAYTTNTETEKEMWRQQYNRFLVDAFIEGRLNLDYGNPEKLLSAERPYDYNYRLLNNDKYRRDVDWFWDWSWYKGKFYCYYGPIPAALLYVPYKIITGNYLSDHAGVFIFCALSIIMIAMFWRHCAKKYMPESLFAFHLLAFLALFFAFGYFWPLRYPSFYSITQSSGMMFILAGLLMLLKSADKEKINFITVISGCFCMALAVGCRPNLVLISFIAIPILLWKHRSWKLIAAILAPYVIVAIPICLYNYARFDNILEFGTTYVLTAQNNTAAGSMDPIAVLIRTFRTIVSYLFLPNKYSLYFPFVECFPRSGVVVSGFLNYTRSGYGLINFPIVVFVISFFKYIFRKERPKSFSLMAVFMIITVVLMYIVRWSFQGRYVFDFSFFIFLPSILCAYYFCVDAKNELLRTVRLKIVYALFAVTIFVGLCLFVTGGMNDANEHYNNPALYRYLEYSLGILRDT